MVVCCEVYEKGGDTQKESCVEPDTMAHSWFAVWCDCNPDRGRLRQLDRKYPTQGGLSPQCEDESRNNSSLVPKLPWLWLEGVTAKHEDTC